MFTFHEHLKMKRKYVSCHIGSTSYLLAIQLSAIYIARYSYRRFFWFSADYIARYIWLQLSAMLPDISGFIAGYMWIWYLMAIQSAKKSKNWVGYMANGHTACGYIAQLHSHICLAIQLKARYIWLCSQIYLAIQPLNSQLTTFAPDISGMHSHRPYNPNSGAIQPKLSGYIVS